MPNKLNEELDRLQVEIRSIQRAMRIETPVVVVLAVLTLVAYGLKWQPLIVGLLTAVTVVQSIRLFSLRRRLREQRLELDHQEKQLAIEALTSSPPRRQRPTVQQLAARVEANRKKKSGPSAKM